MTVYNIAADEDDGYWQPGGAAFSKTGNDRIYIGFGSPNCSGWFRFTGISGLAGKTIDTCVLTLHGYTGGVGEDSAGTTVTTVRMRKTAAAGQPTSVADMDGYTYTTAGVGWTFRLNGATGNSPDLKTVLQEIIDAGIDPSTLLVVVQNDGADADYTVADSYTHAGGTPASLEITSHAPGGARSSHMMLLGAA